jgi:hypothetical protein
VTWVERNALIRVPQAPIVADAPDLIGGANRTVALLRRSRRNKLDPETFPM